MRRSSISAAVNAVPWPGGAGWAWPAGDNLGWAWLQEPRPSALNRVLSAGWPQCRLSATAARLIRAPGCRLPFAATRVRRLDPKARRPHSPSCHGRWPTGRLPGTRPRGGRVIKLAAPAVILAAGESRPGSRVRPPNRAAASAPSHYSGPRPAVGEIPVQSSYGFDTVADSNRHCALLRQEPLKSHTVPTRVRPDRPGSERPGPLHFRRGAMRTISTEGAALSWVCWHRPASARRSTTGGQSRQPATGRRR